MDNRTHTAFDMGQVLNKLRTIAEDGEPNTMVNDDNFTKVMSRLASVKDALPSDEFNALRAGVRSMYMNQRPSQQQLMALLSLLETVLGYVASDNALFQRLKGDLNKGAAAGEPAAPAATQGTAAPGPTPEEPPATPGMRGLK